MQVWSKKHLSFWTYICWTFSSTMCCFWQYFDLSVWQSNGALMVDAAQDIRIVSVITQCILLAIVLIGLEWEARVSVCVCVCLHEWVCLCAVGWFIIVLMCVHACTYIYICLGVHVLVPRLILAYIIIPPLMKLGGILETLCLSVHLSFDVSGLCPVDTFWITQPFAARSIVYDCWEHLCFSDSLK